MSKLKNLWIVFIPLLFAISDIFLDDSTPKISQSKFLKCCKKVPSFDPMSNILLFLLPLLNLLFNKSDTFLKCSDKLFVDPER